MPNDWSRDGRWLALVPYRNGTQHDIWIVQAKAGSKPFPYLKTEFNDGFPRFSPDGQWIAYSSDESGQFEVFVRPFRGETYAPEGKIQVSRGGGTFPLWSRN